MEEVTTMFYDKESDVLYITIGEPQIAISSELENDVLLRVHPETGKVVGMTVLNFAGRFSDFKQQQTLPIHMALSV